MEENDIAREIDLGLAKIMAMANVINRKTELCCMVSDAGHIRQLKVEVYQNCKEIWNQTPCKFEVSYGQPHFDRDSKYRLDQINNCIEFLETCLKDNKVPFGMTEEIRQWVTVGYSI